MLGRLIFLAVLIGLGWYAYDTGIWHGLQTGFEPEIGREGEMCGPHGGKLYMGTTRDSLGFVIGAAEMKSIERVEDAIKLKNALASGLVAEAENHAKVRVLANGRVVVYRAPFDLVQVQVLDGKYAGAIGWIRRENLLDTPLQQLFSKFR